MSFGGVVALVAVCCSVILPAVNGEIENFDEKWRMTIDEMTSPPETVTAQSLSCKGTIFDTPDGTCSLDDRAPATSVHLLTPADIGIVAALGDSITAGFGAKASSIFDSPTKESRGVSWSIGGDGNVYTECTTIPNILRIFNPNVYGASTGSGDESSGGANLNRAVSGAESKDIFSQAVKLVEMIEALSTEQQNQWKLVTLWIGANDLCGNCGNGVITPETYISYIEGTILFLQKRLTKTFVNVAQALDVTKITATTGLVCGVVQWYACDCAKEDGTSERAKQYMEKLNDFVDNFQSDDTFAVVLQPFFKEMDIPREKNGEVDMSFFAPDCFHMSVLGHRAIAAALWNNMVTDIPDKEHNWHPYNPVLQCPDPARPYFYTDRTKALLEGQSQGFNSQSLPSEEETGNSNDNKDGWSVGQIFGVTIGVAVTAYAALVLVGVAIAGAVWVRKHRRGSDSEAIPLVK